MSYRVRKEKYLGLEWGKTGKHKAFYILSGSGPVAVASTWGSFQALMKSSSPPERKALKTNKQILENLKVAWLLLSISSAVTSGDFNCKFWGAVSFSWSCDQASFCFWEVGVENVIYECSETTAATQSGLKRSFFPYVVLETAESSDFCSFQTSIF